MIFQFWHNLHKY